MLFCKNSGQEDAQGQEGVDELQRKGQARSQEGKEEDHGTHGAVHAGHTVEALVAKMVDDF